MKSKLVFIVLFLLLCRLNVFSQTTDSRDSTSYNQNYCLNTKFTLILLGGSNFKYNMFGPGAELEIPQGDNFNYLIGFNPLFSNRIKKINFETFLLNAGVKPYLIRGNTSAYLSFNGVALLGWDYPFGASTGIGLEFKIDKTKKFNLELKTLLTTFNLIQPFFCFNAGFIFNVNK